MDQPMQLTTDEFDSLVHSLDEYLAGNYASSCLDDEEDRMRVAAGVAAWMISDKVTLESPERLLPKVRYHLSFDVVDEATGQHIIRLTLDRTRDMTDGDFMNLQNFFWRTVGCAIRDNPDVIRTLAVGGVRVEIDPPGGANGQQFAV